jgi:hypothetical protein
VARTAERLRKNIISTLNTMPPISDDPVFETSRALSFVIKRGINNQNPKLKIRHTKRIISYDTFITLKMQEFLENTKNKIRLKQRVFTQFAS